jgi:hypothetical protein
MSRVHYRARLAGDDWPIPAVGTARVGGQVAWLDPREAAASALVELAQALMVKLVMHSPHQKAN